MYLPYSVLLYFIFYSTRVKTETSILHSYIKPAEKLVASVALEKQVCLIHFTKCIKIGAFLAKKIQLMLQCYQ